MQNGTHDNASLFYALVGDGRPLLIFVGLILVLVGVFALVLSLSGHFLPHDVQFLGMNADDLCVYHGCRIVHFMMHDRASFGGALFAIGVLYLWLAYFPLACGEAWAWWTLAISGAVGFASFLAYLGYGYLDTWHGLATLVLLPCQMAGLIRTFRHLHGSRGLSALWCGCLWGRPFSRERIGQAMLLGTGVGMTGGGLIIAILGMTCVFVPQDLVYMGVDVAELRRLNQRLIPLIAHDRAGFGGAIACLGLLVVGCNWLGKPSRSLWQALGAAGVVAFIPAIGIHFVIGYDDMLHLAPAVGAAAIYFVGLILLRPSMYARVNEFHPNEIAIVVAPLSAPSVCGNTVSPGKQCDSDIGT